MSKVIDAHIHIWANGTPRGAHRQLPYRSFGISFNYKFGKLEFKKSKDDDSYLNNPPVMGN